MKWFFPLKSPFFWCVAIPLALMGIQLVLECLAPQALYARLHTENSPVEILQWLTIGAAFFLAVRLLLDLRFRPPIPLSLWVTIAALGCFYVAGEEISWGQHFLNWNTPEYWAAINDQSETNLHNISSWLDQKPRLLLELGVIFGGFLLPLYRRFTRKNFPVWLDMIAPPGKLMLVAGIVLFIKLADKFGEASGMVLFGRGSEVGEFYIFYFVLLYLVFLGRKVRPGLDKPEPPSKSL